jgi:hypothetical protein
MSNISESIVVTGTGEKGLMRSWAQLKREALFALQIRIDDSNWINVVFIILYLQQELISFIEVNIKCNRPYNVCMHRNTAVVDDDPQDSNGRIYVTGYRSP